MPLVPLVKFIYSEKATIFCEIFTIDLSYAVTVKSTVEISQNFVAFSEYMNFIGVSWEKNPIYGASQTNIRPFLFCFRQKGPLQAELGIL